MRCEACREQLLLILYDLLEPGEAEAVAGHLEDCPECRSALLLAREQQGMLADAVKEKHADIVFQAPSRATPASAAPTLVLQRPSRRRFALSRWSVAAAILLGIFGGSAVGWSIWREQADVLHHSAERLVKAKESLGKSQEELKQKEAQTQAEIRAIQDQIDTLFSNWKKEETKTRKVLDERGAQLIIKGPQNILAGANTNYEVELRSEADATDKVLSQQVANSKDVSKGAKGDQNSQLNTVPQLQVRAFNPRTNETLFQQDLKVRATTNTANFVLPSNIPIKPGDDIALEFQTQAAAGKLITFTDNIKLDFPEYITHLATDRPLYRPGETIRFRSLTLERFSLKPAQEKFHLRYRITGPNNIEIYSEEAASTVVAGPTNEPIKGPNGEMLHCLGAGEFVLPTNLSPGQYTLHVSEGNDRFKEEKRVFLIKHWQPARFAKEVHFDRNSYAPGELVKLQTRVVPIQGLQSEQVSQIRVKVRIVVDDAEILNQEGGVDSEGKAAFECKLPTEIAGGIGTVTLECQANGVNETLERDLPLAARDVQVEFFPEGGDLIAGAANRVYFQARTPSNRPAECAGRIVDENDQEVARFETMKGDKNIGFNQGLGIFEFAPEVRKQYRFVIDSPTGIRRAMPLPIAKAQGVVMTVPMAGVIESEIEVNLVSVEQRRELLVGAYCRGRMLDHQVVRAGAGQPVSVVLRPDPAVGGVYRVTVFETVRAESGISFRPVAERLVYRKSSAKVDVTLSRDRTTYRGGDTVRLALQAQTESKALAPAIAMVAVVDNTILKMADEKTARGLPAHFLLGNEVRNPENLEYANGLLANHPSAQAALDLLLGCQGWRRFAEQNPQRFLEKQPQAKQARFLANTDIVTQFVEKEQKQLDKLDQDFVNEAIEMQKKLAATEKREASTAELASAVQMQQSSVLRAQQELAQADRRLADIRTLLTRLSLAGVLIPLLFVSVFLIGTRAHVGLGILVAALSVLVLIAFVATTAIKNENRLEFVQNEVDVPKRFAVPDSKVNEQPSFYLEPIGKQETRLADTIGTLSELKSQSKSTEEAKTMVALPAPPQVGKDVGDDRALRQQSNYQAVLTKNLGRRVQLPPAQNRCVVREFAYRFRTDAIDLERDFIPTIYWHPVLVLPGGNGQIQFDLPTFGNRFQVLIHSFTFDGRLGTNQAEIITSQPSGVLHR